MDPNKKKHLLWGLGLGAVIGLAVSGVIWYTSNSVVLAVAVVPVAAILGGLQLYWLSDKRE